MPLRAEYTLHHSDLGDFLSAPVWEETNGSPLSVLSALARLDVDPWAEAARLAALPRGTAASALAAILRRLPGDQPDTLDAAAIAARLVMLLPKGGSATTITAPSSAGNAQPLRGMGRGMGIIGRWEIVALLAIFVAWVMIRIWS